MQVSLYSLYHSKTQGDVDLYTAAFVSKWSRG